MTALGLSSATKIHRNLSVSELYEHAIRNNEGLLGADGQFVVETGKHTGRSPHDKFFVREPSSEQHIDWGTTNKPFEAAKFDALLGRVTAYLKDRELYALDCYVGADPQFQLPVRVITQSAWQNIFARDLLIDTADHVEGFTPEFTVLDAALFEADPARDGTNSSTFILINFARKLVLIGGTEYAGEIKKSVFTIMNYLMPLRDVLPMHCSANVGKADDVAVIFGLSGTGKTTLSADPSRPLIGDDEHGWSNDGVFNFEGGCYAKAIKLLAEQEPEIWAASHQFGTVLENVVIDPVTRGARPRLRRADRKHPCGVSDRFIPNVVPGRVAGHPDDVVMLTADAFGVLPPISRMSAAAGDVSLPLRLHRKGRRHRARRRPNRPRRSRPASARRSWCTIRRSTPNCSANTSPSTTSDAGW